MIEITTRVRRGMGRVEITKVVVPAGNIETWAKNCLKLANRLADPAGEELIFPGDSGESG